jgi:AcrR family transcriptional regulator
VFEMSEIPTPPWDRVPQRGTGRRRDPLTRDQIVKAAVKLLDAEGLDGLSMRRLADDLGTGAASLYWHVGSKDGLLDLVFDELIGELAVPDPQPDQWQEQLKDIARTMRASILRHRDLVRISIGRIPLGPNALRWSERVVAILRAGGVPDDLAVRGQLLLISLVNGFTLDETGDMGEPPEGEPPADQAGAMVRDYLASLPAEQFPNLIAVADHYGFSDLEQHFELLLDLFVSGLARHVEARVAAD